MFSSKSTPKKLPTEVSGMGGDKSSIDIDAFLSATEDVAATPAQGAKPKSSMKASSVKTVPATHTFLPELAELEKILKQYNGGLGVNDRAKSG